MLRVSAANALVTAEHIQQHLEAVRRRGSRPRQLGRRGRWSSGSWPRRLARTTGRARIQPIRCRFLLLSWGPDMRLWGAAVAASRGERAAPRCLTALAGRIITGWGIYFAAWRRSQLPRCMPQARRSCPFIIPRSPFPIMPFPLCCLRPRRERSTFPLSFAATSTPVSGGVACGDGHAKATNSVLQTACRSCK